MAWPGVVEQVGILAGNLLKNFACPHASPLPLAGALAHLALAALRAAADRSALLIPAHRAAAAALDASALAPADIPAARALPPAAAITLAAACSS
jgi:hypothetical protein